MAITSKMDRFSKVFWWEFAHQYFTR